MACGILPDQGSNPCPLHWQADSQRLRHQGSAILIFKNSFCFAAWVISTNPSSRSLIHSSISSNLLLIPSSVLFHFSCILQLWLSLLCIFYLFVEVLIVFIHSSPKFCEHICDHYLELFYWVDYLSPFRLVLFLRFLSCSFIWNIFFCILILPNSVFTSFYLISLLHLSTLEKWPYVVYVLWDPVACPPLATRARCVKGAPYVSCMHLSVVVVLTAEGTEVCRADTWPCWLRDCGVCDSCRHTQVE